MTRWWDGQQWGQVAATPAVPAAGPGTEPKTMAMLAHLLGLFVGVLGPLIIYLINGEEDPYVRHQAAEALNFHLTLLIGYVVSIVLMIVLIGFLTFFVLWILGIVLSIMGAVAANRGEWYRYPINIRMVSGAVG